MRFDVSTGVIDAAGGTSSHIRRAIKITGSDTTIISQLDLSRDLYIPVTAVHLPSILIKPIAFLSIAVLSLWRCDAATAGQRRTDTDRSTTIITELSRVKLHNSGRFKSDRFTGTRLIDFENF